MCLVIYWLEQIYPTNMMSYHEIGLRVSVVIKFYALDFHLVTQLFQKIWQRYLVKKCCFKCCLTLSWWRPLSYGNQSWFLYDIGLRHERVKKGWNAKRTVAAKKRNNSLLSICKWRGKCDFLWLKADTFLYTFILFMNYYLFSFQISFQPISLIVFFCISQCKCVYLEVLKMVRKF